MRRRDFVRASTLGAGVSLLGEACGGQEEQFLVQELRRSSSILPGQSVWRPGVCIQCPAACGTVVRVVDGNAKKIEGNADHPVNRGGVCALGHSLLQELYNPDRLLTPLRRSGPRGAGEFAPVSREEALGELVEALGSTPPERIAFVVGDRSGAAAVLLRRLSDALGALPPAVLEPPGLEVERRAAQISLGLDELPYFDLSRSDYVLSIGAPLVDRWHSPVHYTRALADMRRGRVGRRGRLAQAEPRMSLTAANADEWLPLRPGSEGVFARTVAGVLISEDLVGGEALTRYRRLFPDAPPSLAEGAGACDLPEEKIQRVARDLAAAQSRVVVAGGSAAGHTNGLFNVAAGLGLNLLLDTLGRPGGVYASASFGLLRSLVPPEAQGSTLADVAARLRGESPDPVDLLVVVDADPLHALPASWGLEGALDSVTKVVALSGFLDDTAIQADLVLPLATELEGFSAVEPSGGSAVAVLSLADPVVDPLGDGRPPADILLEVGAALGEPVASLFPWADLASLVESRVAEELERLPGADGAQATEYFSAALARGGIFGPEGPSSAPPGPTEPGPGFSESRFGGDPAEYPFILVPFESVKIGDGRGANRPWLQELPDPLSTVMWGSWVELAPSDAARLGLEDGDIVRLASEAGDVEAPALIDPSVRPGLVGMPLGQGHREYGRYARERGTNPLDLVGRLQVDGASAPAWAATRVRLERVDRGRLTRFGRSYADRGATERIPVGWIPQSAVDGRLG